MEQKSYTEELIKTLEFIQDIITRMANNSFNLKGWTIAILTVFTIFLSVDFESPPILILFLIIPILGFSLLDAYYLNNERRYRTLYNQAINDSSFKVFNLNAFTPDIKEKTAYCKAYFSISIIPFYLPIILLIIVYYFFLK